MITTTRVQNFGKKKICSFPPYTKTQQLRHKKLMVITSVKAIHDPKAFIHEITICFYIKTIYM